MQIEDLQFVFKDLLNRTDCTEDHVARFLDLALSRVQRILKLDFQRTTVDLVSPYGLPSDYLSAVLLKVNGKTCRRVPLTYDAEAGDLTPLYQIDNGRVVFPNGDPNGTVSLTYLKKMAGAPYSDAIADVVIYAALIYAADTFLDERKPSFENSFQQFLAEVQLANDLDQFSGLYLAVSNPYEGTI